MRTILSYLAGLDRRRILLWWALIWYLVMVARHPPESVQVWFRAVGIGALVGVLLTANALAPGESLRSVNRWSLFRFFLIPFCVSSYSAVSSEAGFWLLISPFAGDNLLALGSCVAFGGMALLGRRISGKSCPPFFG